MKRFVLVLALFTATTAVSWAKAPSISAELDPAEIAFGDSAQLTVTVTGQNSSEPGLPSVPGLSFDHVGQSSQIQVINGAMSATIAHTYLVTPSHPGTFTIPQLNVGRGAHAAGSNPLVLKVLKRSGSGTPSRPGNSSGQNLPAPTVNSADDELPSVGRNEIGFLHVVAPKREFYVGELVPVELKAYFRAGVELRVDGLPQLNSDAFTMNKLGTQPARSQELIDGQPFNVFTWPTAITAVKAGDYDMTVEIPTTVTVRQRAARPRSPFGDSFFDDAFNDPFFNQFFGTATQKQVKLSSAGAGAKVLSTPTENRPASFAGAVGQFEATATATPSRAAVGDPITLKLSVTGRGNFDRVTPPPVESNNNWKVYPPGAKFEAEDSAGYEGTKTFETALVPRQSGRLEIPALAFSYFDPEKRSYVTRSTTPMTVDVTPGTESVTPPATETTRENVPAGDPAPVAKDELAPNKPATGSFTSTLRPWFLSPERLGLALLPLPIAAAGLLMLRHREKGANNPERARALDAQRALQVHLNAMESAAQRGETGGFFNAARAALQQRLSRRWNLRPETISLAEINARMNGEADGFRPLFELADEVAYTGRSFTAAELRSWIKVVNTELNKLEAR